MSAQMVNQCSLLQRSKNENSCLFMFKLFKVIWGQFLNFVKCFETGLPTLDSRLQEGDLITRASDGTRVGDKIPKVYTSMSL